MLSPLVFMSQTICHPLYQFDLIVEALRHAVGGAVPNGTRHGLKPPRQRSRSPPPRLLGALARALNAFQQRLSGGFLLCALAPLTRVLHPVQRFTQLRKTSAPLVTRDQLGVSHLLHGLLTRF